MHQDLIMFSARIDSQQRSGGTNDSTVGVGGGGGGGGTNIFHAEIETDGGRFKYQDGEVYLLQNQRKPIDFFFTPFPHIEPNLTECSLNEFSGHNELTLSVSLYTPNLINSIGDHLKQHYNICRIQHCDVSPLPMHSIRLFQKGLRTNDTQSKYTLDKEWQSNTQLRQTVELIIYTSTMSVCESARTSLTSRCRLPNFDIRYSLHAQQTATRQLGINTEHITSTTMYNQICSQFPSNQDLIALTGNDYKNLLMEATDSITMSLRVEEGYESLQDSVAIDKIIDRQLQYKQVQLKSVNDHLWDSLY
ncbi:unnamed protein product [Didymodactylos carnosus]|uniref:Uncharacterized protein n=1 Tax=Didymodactylos carnosus TaxID=1234261 RepID=A0A814JL79_9BILA|nr:unnamed protein product [Didymodactylos carnosus]CAF3809837.1 unnamed protein product [Didymodactylos carnosus]